MHSLQAPSTLFRHGQSLDRWDMLRGGTITQREAALLRAGANRSLLYLFMYVYVLITKHKAEKVKLKTSILQAATLTKSSSGG